MSHRLTLFDYVCSNADKFALLLAFECLAGLLSLALFFGSEPGTSQHVVSILNIAGASVLGAATAAILLKCYRT
ncbi:MULTISPECIES: hypothetical protein [unclassified Haladaptatus]|uniref:hypothetical protein n=1 Tax=unclassified Haladaptatus TaxID=2622732 RepID=UPI00209C23AC|nr:MULTISPECIES: hypothetical protein [unclassified Haladaptatus]MCO8246740.1 hypothetical protein [Haladaptatus sp. AB643]MCO8256388.1 hypothetical protein [Haladaptatus sp. AB618]